MTPQHSFTRAAARHLAGALLATAVLTGCAASNRASPSDETAPFANPAITSAHGLEVFDTAWARIDRSHYDSTFNGVDWDAVREELRPRAGAAASMASLRAVIQDMLSRLGESHHGLIPRELADAVDPEALRAHAAASERPGDAGMELRLAGGRVVVTRVAPDGPAAAAGVRPGWVVESIDDRPLAAAVSGLAHLGSDAEWRVGVTRFLYSTNALLDGAAGSAVRLALLDGDDRPLRIELRRRDRPGEPVRLGNLPTFLAKLDYRRVERSGGCTGIIRFNVWMIPVAPEFDRAIDALRECAGIVVDLRGNPGGVAGMVMGISGHFLDRTVALGIMRSRAGELRFVSNPRRVTSDGRPVQPYGGRLAVLIDAMAASTSEFFAGGMQAIGRARVFGETSAGQALPAVLNRLPNGDVLMYVVADYTDPDGNRFEGAGVIPDVPVPLRRDDLLAGRDAALEAALRWIAAAPRASIP